ncbi:MAG: molecular chaperone [Betaproteobacteria bacterium]|nr:MAG: molecular chaperone [Betaproteobacteria bacterium]
MTTTALAPEEVARSNIYGLLAQLFYAPPDQALLLGLAQVKPGDGDSAPTAMGDAWRELARGAASADAEAVREEYESLFFGTGRAEISLYAGAYRRAHAGDNPLVQLRDFMAQHGFVRRNGVVEPEDHVAALCEVMRHLIMQDDVAAQRTLFAAHLWPGLLPLCDAVSSHGRASFYAPVARLAKTFFELEHSAFDMD